MEQLSLFGEPAPNTKDDENLSQKDDVASKLPKMVRSFGPVYYDRIIDGINKGLNAKEICENLINKHGAPSDTFSQGTPRIYPLLMIYLEFLAEEIEMTHVDQVGNGTFTPLTNASERPQIILNAKFQIKK
ncbi:DUF3895 domain-containing protein [Desertibacillus haloalkaliphilus]|uniref:DUF3895 domain-containing protein n=1 Tax=Desertibacillus haloalkaliphilus TaxID=1328930 RepID=UPI001C25809A|nr:DUF3895 domain-containing protein [Desertibacillus haloalkaliphilus]MBU8908119.1 DUF3895 domain-containing protein [Desertibacillus haloalkaliphilus]